jgi:cell division GTPase FtsZ
MSVRMPASNEQPETGLVRFTGPRGLTLVEVGHPINTETRSVWSATVIFHIARDESVNDEMRATLLTR